MFETSLKFALHPSFVLPDLSGLNGVAGVEELPIQESASTYFDTRDLRLARSGAILRFTEPLSGDPPAWRLSLPEIEEGGPKDKLRFEGRRDEIPMEVRELTTAFARTEEISEKSVLHTRRRRWVFRSVGDSEVAEIVDDEVSILEGQAVIARYREMYVSSKRSHLRSFVDALRSAGAAVTEPLPKYVRALGPQATAAPDVLDPGAVKPSDPAHLAIEKALSNGVARLLLNDPGARLEDPEAVHQMRVATRRLRSGLRTFAPLLHSGWSDALGIELRWLADALGRVRDLNVFDERLAHTAPELVGDLDPLLGEVRRRLAIATNELRGVLNSRRYRKLLEQLVDAARHPQTTDQATQPCSASLPRLISTRWKKLRKGALTLDERSSASDWHRVRIEAKRTRYPAEAVAPSLGKLSNAANRFAKKVEQLQEVLGQQQDALAAGHLTREIALQREGKEAFHLAAGIVIAREEQAASRAMASFDRVWKAVDKNKFHSWFR